MSLLQRFSDLSIRKKLQTIILINTIFFLLIGLVTYYNFSEQRHTQQAVMTNSDLSVTVLMLSNGTRAYKADIFYSLLVTPENEADKERFQTLSQQLEVHRKMITQAAEKLKTVDAAGPVGQDIRDLSEMINQYLPSSQKMYEMALKTHVDDSTEVVSFKAQVDEYDKLYLALESKLDGISQQLNAQAEQTVSATSSQARSLQVLVFAFIVVSIVLSVWVTLFIAKRVVTPVLHTRSKIEEIMKGQVPERTTVTSRDETGQMLSSLYRFVDSIQEAQQFVLQVAEGNFQTETSSLEAKIIEAPLLKMRDNLQQANLEDKKRSWVSEGFAQLGELLRQNSSDNDIFYNDLLRFIVKYLQSTQGALFLVKGDHQQGEDTYLDLVASYAYDRRKFLEKRIPIGDGLVGQAYLEKDIIYLKQVPQNFVTITSGLGDATPNSLIIVPLMANNRVEGILELASFERYEPTQIEFLKKAAESIASTIAAVKINEQTHDLLIEAQEQTEIMRAQEEEMRQNLEEIAATQEEMNRKEKMYLQEIMELRSELAQSKQVSLLDSMTDGSN